MPSVERPRWQPPRRAGPCDRSFRRASLESALCFAAWEMFVTAGRRILMQWFGSWDTESPIQPLLFFLGRFACRCTWPCAPSSEWWIGRLNAGVNPTSAVWDMPALVADPKLPRLPFVGRQDDIDTAKLRELQEQDPGAESQLRAPCSLLQALPQHVGEKTDQDMRLRATGLLMPARTQRQIGLLNSERGFPSGPGLARCRSA